VRVGLGSPAKAGVREQTSEGMQTAESIQQEAEKKERKVGTKKHTMVRVNSKAPRSMSYTVFIAVSRQQAADSRYKREKRYQ
jgi:hypothetical protein